MSEVGTAPVRAVVFDLFDTLVDLHSERMVPIEWNGAPLAGTARALYETFARRVPGIAFDRFAETLQAVDAEFRTSRYAEGRELPTGERFATLIERVGGDAALVDALVGVHMDALRGHVRILDHHADVLKKLSATVSLALCSNFSHSETAMRVLEEAGLREYFDVITVSDVKGFRKPRPEIFREALSGLGVGPAEALHVGDNLHADVGGAGALGIRTVWLTRRVKNRAAHEERYEGPPPDFVVHDLAELLPLVERLNGRCSE